MMHRIFDRFIPIDTLLAGQIGIAHTFRITAIEADDNLVFDIEILIGINILRFNKPTMTDEDDRCLYFAGVGESEKIFAKTILLTIDIDMRLSGIDAIMFQSNILKIGAVIAHGFESPLREVH